ncbi:MAG: ComEC/Rec2 family competence protein [Clostridia bacterium]|nr:ComEC/Rec2 family competence protein [Clostridia bacterium]
MTDRRPWFHTRPMAGAALGAILAAILGSLAPDRVLLIVCAVLIPVSAFLLHRRSAFFLLPLAAFAVLVRIVLLPTELPGGSVADFLSNLRGNLLANADALFRDEAAAGRGILLGDHAAMTAAEYAQYAQSGLLHLFAVSGLHVTILVGMIGRFIRTENKALSFGVLSLVLLFLCAVTGFTASVLRAAFTLIALNLSELRERKADMPSVLCFAFAMTLLCEPFAYETVGFQLSFAAMTGMVLFAGKLRRSLPKPLRGSLIARALIGAATAMIGMLPLTAYYFQTLAWIAIPLSIVLIPTMPILLLFGFLSVLLYGLLPHVAAVLSYPAYGAIKLIAIVAQNLDVPALRLPAPHPAAIVLYYLALLLCSPLLLRNRKRPPWLGLGLLTVSIVLWFLL